MLENHEDNEDKPQKKKRKLSSSQENNSCTQDISFIKVLALNKALFSVLNIIPHPLYFNMSNT